MAWRRQTDEIGTSPLANGTSPSALDGAAALPESAGKQPLSAHGTTSCVDGTNSCREDCNRGRIKCVMYPSPTGDGLTDNLREIHHDFAHSDSRNGHGSRLVRTGSHCHAVSCSNA